MIHSVRHHIHRLAEFLTRATPIMLIMVFVFFAYQTAGFQRDNRTILNDTKATVKNTEHISENTHKIIDDLQAAVKDLQADNARQTDLIICVLAIHGETTAVTEADEEACRVLVDEAELNPDSSNFVPSLEPLPQVKPQSFPEPEQPSSPDSPQSDTPSRPPTDQPTDTPSEEPGLIASLIRTIDRLLSPITNLLRGAL